MAESSVTFFEALCKGDKLAVDWLREGVHLLTQELMDAEVSRQIGAEKHERREERTTQRHGYRERGYPRSGWGYASGDD